MKLSSFLLIVLSILFYACRKNDLKQTETVELSSQYFLKDLTEVKLDIYAIDRIMYPILDSIIEKVLACPNNLNQQLGFIFSIDDKLGKEFTISNTTNLNAQYYIAYKGVFYYKGYQFGIYGDPNINYLKKLDRKVKVFSISYEKFPTWYQDTKFNSYWIYYLKNGQFECDVIKYCGIYTRK